MKTYTLWRGHNPLIAYNGKYNDPRSKFRVAPDTMTHGACPHHFTDHEEAKLVAAAHDGLEIVANIIGVRRSK